jgi:hypothetical protein
MKKEIWFVYFAELFFSLFSFFETPLKEFSGHLKVEQRAQLLVLDLVMLVGLMMMETFGYLAVRDMAAQILPVRPLFILFFFQDEKDI